LHGLAFKRRKLYRLRAAEQAADTNSFEHMRDSRTLEHVLQ
jgi:hypothetical protein